MNLNERLVTVCRVIRTNSMGDHATTVLVLETRVLAFREDSALIKQSLSLGAVEVGTYDSNDAGADLFAKVTTDVMRVFDVRHTFQDAKQKVKREPGGRLIGRSHPHAILNEEAVRIIRSAHDDEGMGYKQIASLTGVTKETARDVCTMRTWRHVH